MKKKIFLSLAIMAMLIFAFSIMASADTIVTSTSNAYGELTVFDEPIGNTGISNLKDDGTIARTVLFDGTSYYTVPTTYILTESPKNVGGAVKEMLLINFNEINTKLSKSFNKNSIIRSEIPSDIAYICNGNETYNNCNNVIEIIVNDGLRIWDNYDRKVFTNCKKLVSIDISGMILENTQNTFAMFEYCESLESIVLPDAYHNGTGYVNYDTDHMFSGCKKLSRIENFEGFFQGVKSLGYKTFYNCYVLPNVTLWDNLTAIEGRAFGNCQSFTSVVIPNGVKTIGTTETVFESCTKLKTVVLPAQVSLGNYCFEKCTALEAVWMPTQASTFGKQVFGQCGNSLNVTFYFSTAASTITIENMENNKDPFITAIKAENDARIAYSTPLTTKCTVFLGGHALSPIAGDYIVYPNGYANAGAKVDVCAQCSLRVEEVKSALFTCLGYSASEFGFGGVAIGYVVNDIAISEYESVTGKSVKYGVFAVLKDKLGENDVFAQDGTAADGVVSAEVGAFGLAAFEIKITGFTSEQKDIKIAMGGYVMLTKGETTEYSYMQIGTPSEGEKYCFASFNDMVAQLN